MNKNFRAWLRTFALAAPAAFFGAALLAEASFGQNPAPAPAGEVKDAVQDSKDAAKDTAKDTAKDAKDAAKDTAKDARDTVQDARDAAKDTAKDARDAAKDTSKDVRDAAKDTTRDARDTAKDARDTAQDTSKNARDAVRDTRQDARDTVRDTRDSARDAVRDTRDSARDATRDTVRDPRDPRNPGRDQSRDARDPENLRNPRDNARDSVRDSGDAREGSRTDVSASFRAEGTRAADFGLWFERDTAKGLVIADVATTGAIAKLGFREGDRIVSVNGQRVTRETDFVTYLFDEEYRSQRIKVIVIRDGREEVIFVEPAVIIEEVAYEHHDPLETFGVVIDDRYDDRIVVWRVLPRSPAYYAGIRAGDVFVSFGGRRLAGVQNLVQTLTNADPGEVQVQVNRGDAQRNITVDVPRFEARSERRTSLRPNFDAAERREDAIDRRDERRDDRIDRRDDRVDDRQDRREDRAVTPTTPTPRVPNTPAPGTVPVPNPAPNVTPPAAAPAPTPAPRTQGNPAPRPGLFPRNR